jgi:4-amino-4-deoxy-L-arabinose transferase-like glycosyltransferase
MPELDGRRPSDLRWSPVFLALIICLAAALRFWALGHGIPYGLGVDEPEILERAVNMMKSGSLHPRFFDYPTLYIYIQMGTACLRFLAGAVGGAWSSLDQAGAEHFYLWGRATTALFGTATVWIVFRIGRWWNDTHALLAAALLAVFPLHVRESHYVLTDVPLTFFVSLTTLLSLRAHDLGTSGSFAWAGVAAGLGTATKYNGAIALVLPLLAGLTTRPARRPRIVLMLVAAGCCVLAFLAGSPYSFLDLPAFLNGFARLSSEYRNLPGYAEPGWSLYLKHLRLALNWPAFLLLAAGLALGVMRLTRRPERMRWAAVTVFPILYFAFVADQKLIFARYLLPIAPAICLLIAAAILASRLPLQRYGTSPRLQAAAVAFLAIVAMLPPTLQAVRHDLTIGRQSTVEQAYLWIHGNVPRGARIAIETRALLLAPGDYRAQNFPRLIADHLSHGPREYQTYLDEGYQYLVASSQAYGSIFAAPQAAIAEYAAYRRIFDQSTEVHRIVPSRQHPGPEIRIFRLGAQAPAHSEPPSPAGAAATRE